MLWPIRLVYLSLLMLRPIKYATRRGISSRRSRSGGIDQEALELLVHYPWPGNVRELENVIERAVALATSGKTLTATYFPSHIADQQAVRIPLPSGTGTLRQARAAFEREYIAEVLRQHQGNAVRTANVLGISRQMLQKKIKDYGLRSR